MAKYRPLKTSFWTDDWIATLSAQEKLLYLYLLTNPHTTLCGIYRVSIRYLSFETGLTNNQVIKALEKFTEAGKVFYQDEWIVLVNYQKHQSKSPKVQKGIEREISEIPQEIGNLRYGIDRVSIHIDKPILKLQPKPILKPNGLEPKGSCEFKKEFTDLIQKYSKGTGSTIRALKPRYAKYKARRKTFSASEILSALEAMLADEFLQGGNDSSKRYGDIDYLLRSDQQVEKLLTNKKLKCKTIQEVPSAASIEI